VLPKHSAVVFVHGCFWHRHPGCPHASTPATRQGYWLPKFKRTIERDRKNQAELRRRGWNVIVVWECELREPDKLSQRLTSFFNTQQHFCSKGPQSLLMAAEQQAIYHSTKDQIEPVESE
jgi:DNA mismatch endonuclease (patch repair protein)